MFYHLFWSLYGKPTHRVSVDQVGPKSGRSKDAETKFQVDLYAMICLLNSYSWSRSWSGVYLYQASSMLPAATTRDPAAISIPTALLLCCTSAYRWLDKGPVCAENLFNKVLNVKVFFHLFICKVINHYLILKLSQDLIYKKKV